MGTWPIRDRSIGKGFYFYAEADACDASVCLVQQKEERKKEKKEKKEERAQCSVER